MSNRSSAGALIGDTANLNQQSTQIKSSPMLVFEERGNRSTRRKPLGAEQRTNKINPHMAPDLQIEPGPHWWEAVLSPLRHPCIIGSFCEPTRCNSSPISFQENRNMAKRRFLHVLEPILEDLPFFTLTCCVSFTFPQHNV